MALFIVVPLFIVALALGVQSWLWRILFAALALVAWRFLGPAWIAVPVFLTIGIWLRDRLYRITGSKV
ncbi:MAG TPA: hypothetical protein VM716_00875 [Gemmatimonadales bacterium]|nr:hypothetical protein [Gemmatimonadales bacterium]